MNIELMGLVCGLFDKLQKVQEEHAQKLMEDAENDAAKTSKSSAASANDDNYSLASNDDISLNEYIASGINCYHQHRTPAVAALALAQVELFKKGVLVFITDCEPANLNHVRVDLIVSGSKKELEEVMQALPPQLLTNLQSHFLIEIKLDPEVAQSENNSANNSANNSPTTNPLRALFSATTAAIKLPPPERQLFSPQEGGDALDSLAPRNRDSAVKEPVRRLSGAAVGVIGLLRRRVSDASATTNSEPVSKLWQQVQEEDDDASASASSAVLTTSALVVSTSSVVTSAAATTTSTTVHALPSNSSFSHVPHKPQQPPVTEGVKPTFRRR